MVIWLRVIKGGVESYICLVRLIEEERGMSVYYVVRVLSI